MINTLTIGELQDAIAHLDKDLPVVAVCDYGDRQHTMQAVALGEVETGILSTSSYSSSGYKVTSDEPDDEASVVAVLNYNQLD